MPIARFPFAHRLQDVALADADNFVERAENGQHVASLYRPFSRRGFQALPMAHLHNLQIKLLAKICLPQVFAHQRRLFGHTHFDDVMVEGVIIGQFPCGGVVGEQTLANENHV